MAQPKEYVAIACWGRNLGSYLYYVEQEQQRASRDNAPIDALYERDGKWVCVSDLSPDHHFHRQLELFKAK